MNLEQELAATFEALVPQTDSTIPSNLVEAMRYSLLAPGKRIRPRLVLASGELVGLTPKPLLPAAFSIEMFHCFTLIHDDLPCMDNDDMRRGRPSNHKVYGDGLALLAGDTLFSLAFELFSSLASTFPPAAFQAALAIYCRAMGPKGVMGGQAAEMLLNSRSTQSDLQQMHAQKTGALFDASILIPLALSGMEPAAPQMQATAEFSRALGSAFQIADDLEDAKQDQGKPLSILFHLTPTQAAKEATDRLQNGCARIQQHFSTRAHSLCEIAETVQKRLKPVAI